MVSAVAGETCPVLRSSGPSYPYSWHTGLLYDTLIGLFHAGWKFKRDELPRDRPHGLCVNFLLLYLCVFCSLLRAKYTTHIQLHSSVFIRQCSKLDVDDVLRATREIHCVRESSSNQSCIISDFYRIISDPWLECRLEIPNPQNRTKTTKNAMPRRHCPAELLTIMESIQPSAVGTENTRKTWVAFDTATRVRLG